MSFKKILIANRGEIAVRVIRACRELGIPSVAVYSEADRLALHVRRADEAYEIGPAPSRESYLRIDRILDVAKRCGADAIHPGYGFLSENAAFARACQEAGITFIGPRAETIQAMGEKTSARRIAVEAGVPVVPGTLHPIGGSRRESIPALGPPGSGASLLRPDPVTFDEEIRREAARIGFPLMLKAAAGGGGKGLRLVLHADDLASAALRARSEAKSAFGDDSVYLEKAVLQPRHIEIQVMADEHGNAIHLYERECTIQRRHQKVIEESPSPFLTPDLRERMGALAVALVKKVGYVNAGTLEFLVDKDREPYFLEMNTRLQVEHPVTEMVTGLDLVKLQIRVAQGERLPITQADVRQTGHAIECRVYAEDPERDFLPSPGRIVALRVPGGPGVRDDSGVYEGYEVPIHYDPMISKLVAWGRTREDAIQRMRRAVSEYKVLGIQTTLPFFERVMRHPDFLAGDFDTSFIDRAFPQHEVAREAPWEVAVAAAAIQAYRDRQARRGALTPSAGEGPASGWRVRGWREGPGGRL